VSIVKLQRYVDLVLYNRRCSVITVIITFLITKEANLSLYKR